MAKAAIMTVRAMDAHESVMEMIEQHGNPQYLEDLRNITPAVASSRNPEHRDAFVGILVEGLAEIVQALCYEKTALKENVEALRSENDALKEIIAEYGERLNALDSGTASGTAKKKK